MSNQKRRDGRKGEELRPITLSSNELARVDGSARFTFGDTTALASLSGPIEVRLTAELPSKATFEVLIRPLSHVPATESKYLASIIRSSLEPSLILTKNPRTLVQLVIQSLSPLRADNWNTTLAASMINASTLAFLNASSVPMRAAVAAVAVSRTCQGALIVDPSDEELEESKGLGCFAFTFGGGIDSSESNSECVWASWRSISGNNNEELLEAQKLAKKGAEEVFKFMKQMFSKKQLVDVSMEKAEDEDKDKSGEEEMVE